MNIFDKLFNKSVTNTMSWGYTQGLKQIEHQIQKTIKQGRIVFNGEKQIIFTDKRGNKCFQSYDEMVKTAIELGKWQKNMESLGIKEEAIKEIFAKEYAKMKKEGK